ncbi:MAG TPA: Na+/H+ antiporter [Jatrophihabitantaceae bacterium]|jgi:Na+/H+ antiporter|nr:Na+/H+ antiporter [Jatrophihabitantaceae bacterium]
MIPAVEILALVVTSATVAGFCRRVGASAPLLLVGVGVACSFLSVIPRVDVDPHVILVGLLPPLLYSAAIRTSLIDFRANRQPILLLSVGLVAFSTVTVGLLAWWITPAVTVAAAFAFGAVVAPPDAVAATAVARKVGMPRRVVTILEGESLINDATALVALNTAIAAISHHISPVDVGLDFLLAAGGGVGVGLVAAFVLGAVRKHIEDAVFDTTLSFVAPWVAFLPAEAIHSSGVLAVVVTGLVLGHGSPVLQNATSRIAETINWRTIQFLLENVVFLLIGLQLQQILEGVRKAHLNFGSSAIACAGALAATILARAVWVFASAATYRVGTRGMRGRAWSWPVSAVVSWAGMRGVVTLAAVFLLPIDTPSRDLLRLMAFTVVVGTLMLQGLTLPWLVHRLHLPAPDPAEDALQSAALITEAARAGLAKLDAIITPDDPPDVVKQLRQRAMTRSNVAWEQLGRSHSELEPPAVTYQRLRTQMLEAERDSVLRARDTGLLDDEILRHALTSIDMEESLLERIADATPGSADLVVSNKLGDCVHLRQAPQVAVARTPGVCPECVRTGTAWVHLRMCLTCGNVGCCDSSIGRHAEAHFTATAHPVMRSIEPGEAWRWCYVNHLVG